MEPLYDFFFPNLICSFFSFSLNSGLLSKQHQGENYAISQLPFHGVGGGLRIDILSFQ